MALAIAIACALVMLALLPFIVAGLVLAASGAIELAVHFLAWLLSPLAAAIHLWNRFTFRTMFMLGRCIRATINRLKGKKVTCAR